MKNAMKNLFAAALLAALLLLTACTTPAAETPPSSDTAPVPSSSPAVSTAEAVPPDSPAAAEKISPEEAKAMIDAGGVVVIDVRRADEFEQGHIPGALLLPNETLAEEAEAALPDKNAVLLIYCRSGNRSAQAAKTLVRLGYRSVYDFGGILDWPYETVTGNR